MNSSPHKKMLLALALAFLVYVLFAFAADIKELVEVGGTFPWILVPVVMCLAMGNYLMRFSRWHLYLRKLDIEISPQQSAIVFFAGLSMSISPGKFGELLKAQYIKNINGTHRRRSAPVILAERLTDLIGVLILASFGIFSLDYGHVIFFVVLALILTALFIIASRRFSLWLIRLFSPLPFFGKRVDKLEQAYDNVYALVRPFPLLVATIISILAWGCESIGFYLVINSFPGLNIAFQNTVFIYAFSILVGAVTMLPGGLGVTEGMMAGLLVLLDVPAAVAVAATIITRLATLWFAVTLGILCTGIWRKLLGGSENVAMAGQ